MPVVLAVTVLLNSSCADARPALAAVRLALASSKRLLAELPLAEAVTALVFIDKVLPSTALLVKATLPTTVAVVLLLAEVCALPKAISACRLNTAPSLS